MPTMVKNSLAFFDRMNAIDKQLAKNEKSEKATEIIQKHLD
ncbi:5232_t:CDS:2, partial [Dentiscutata erythropus]